MLKQLKYLSKALKGHNYEVQSNFLANLVTLISTMRSDLSQERRILVSQIYTTYLANFIVKSVEHNFNLRVCLID